MHAPTCTEKGLSSTQPLVNSLRLRSSSKSLRTRPEKPSGSCFAHSSNSIGNWSAVRVSFGRGMRPARLVALFSAFI